MELFMLWFNNDVKTDIKTRIEEGCAYFEHKYSEQPNHCVVNPAQHSPGLVIEGIEIVPSRTITPNHYLIGRKQAVQAMPDINQSIKEIIYEH